MHKSVALIGFSNSGKDTVAQYLIDKQGYTKVSFAGKLKQIISEVYGINKKLLDDPVFKETSHYLINGKTWRQVMQFIGTECFRAIHPETWVNCALLEIDKINLANIPVCVTDCRFIEEVNRLRQEGFLIVYVDRPYLIPDWIEFLIALLGKNKLIQLIVKLFNSKLGHSSEFNIFTLREVADYWLSNASDLKSLEYEIDHIFTYYLRDNVIK